MAEVVQVLVGDPQQLHGVSALDKTSVLRGGFESLLHHSRSSIERLTSTVWPRMARKCTSSYTPPVAHLITQYRMHDAICRVVHGAFYRDNVVCPACQVCSCQVNKMEAL
jgi:superfamily I DNA and/or RNA helicase